jgi:hypothetical protein
MALRPGQLVLIADVPGRYRIDAVTLDGLVAVVEARRVPTGASSLTADPGRGNLDPDTAIGRCLPVLLDLPATGMPETDGFGVTLAIGCDDRFKPTAAVVEANGQPLASVRVERAAIVGVATSILADGNPNVIDATNSLDLQLSNPQAMLYHADSAALAMGANALSVGSEIIQFGRAQALGGGAYRLTELLRGRRGTEWAMVSHSVGEQAVMLDPTSLISLRMDPAMRGALIKLRAYGVADDETDPPTAALPASGESLRPMSPCHLHASLDATSCSLRWVPRRAGSSWSESGAAEPDSAVFGITLRRGIGEIVRTTNVPALELPAAEVSAMGSGPIEIEVIQQGVAPSRPAKITLNA